MNNHEDALSDLAKTAIEACHLGGEIAAKGFGTSFLVRSKQGMHNLVTEYDDLCEQEVIKFIKKKYPDHAFLAEESGGNIQTKKDQVQWIIDPIDGTVNYAHHVPMFAISIAARKNNEILAGSIFVPLLKETFVAEKNIGAYLNGDPISVTKTKTLQESFLATGFPYNLAEENQKILQPLVNVLKTGIPVRRIGVAAIDLAYVAAGRFDGFFEYSLAPWDCAAGVLLIDEAGGKISSWDLSDFNIESYEPILATNGKIHEELAEYLQ